MDRKGGRGNIQRPNRSRKRKTSGNFCGGENETAYTSSAAKKLATSRDEEIIVDGNHSYRIIAFLSVFNAISELVMCKECHGDVKFGEAGTRSLGFKIAVQCSCGAKYINSCPMVDKSFEINRRIIFVMRLLGVGNEGLNMFCGLMDLCQEVPKRVYYATLQNIYCASETVFDLLKKKAAEEEKEENEKHGNPRNDISVSGDGTWKKRGFSSLYGVTTLIGKYTGKVIDVVVKSAYCHICKMWERKCGTPEYEQWIDEHAENCSANHDGSAGKMEVDAVKEMFRRSEECFQVRYANYIGDGDTKTFAGIQADQPYNDLTVKKKECVGHVQKRAGTRLRNVKKTKKLGGKNKLTDKLIKELTLYYGLAIRRHPDSVDDMYNAVWATFYHKISTDENPQHTYCPSGSDSWCKWRQAEAAGTLDQFSHDPPLSEEVAEAIRPIYNDLSSRELLERCLGGETQNNNESFNSTLWRFAPKHLHCGSKTIEIAANLAGGIFNEGYNAILKTMLTMGITIGTQAKIFANQRDEIRLERAARQSLNATKEARIQRRNEQLSLKDFFEDEEGILYGPGIAD